MARPLGLVVAFLVALVLVQAQKPSIPPDGQAYWGATAGENSPTNLAALETMVGRKFAIHRVFFPASGWNKTILPNADTQAADKAGRLVMASFKPAVSWKEVAAGKNDPWLNTLAKSIKSWGKPIWLTWHHEPEGNLLRHKKTTPNTFADDVNAATGNSEADYVAMWRHIHALFAAQGVTNVAWNWITMGAYSFSVGGARTTSVKALYPGDDIIDWIGSDTYNWINPCPWTDAAKYWKHLDTVLDAIYTWALPRNKPLAFPEFGCNEDTTNTSRKAAWFTQIGKNMMAKYPKFKAYVYFNRFHDGCHTWPVETTTNSLNAYSAVGKLPQFGYFHGNAPTTTAAATTTPPATTTTPAATTTKPPATTTTPPATTTTAPPVTPTTSAPTTPPSTITASFTCPLTASVAPGQTVAFTTVVTPTAAIADAVVAFEVFNSSALKIFQMSKTAIDMSANTAVSVSGSWVVPSTQAVGSYSVKVILYGPGWSPLYKAKVNCTWFSVAKRAAALRHGYSPLLPDPVFQTNKAAYTALGANFPAIPVALSPALFGMVDPDPAFAFLASKYDKVKLAGMTPALHGGPVPQTYSLNGVKYVDTNKWDPTKIVTFVNDVAPALVTYGVKDVTWEQSGRAHNLFATAQDNADSISHATVYCKQMRLKVPGVRIWGPYTSSGIPYAAQTLAWKTHLDSGLFDGLAFAVTTSADTGYTTATIDRNAAWIRNYNTQNGKKYQIWWTEYHDTGSFAQRCFHLAYIAAIPEYAIVNSWDPTGSSDGAAAWYSNATLTGWGKVRARLNAFLATPVTRVSDDASSAVFKNGAGATLKIDKVADSYTFSGDNFVLRAATDASSSSSSSSSHIVAPVVAVCAALVVLAVIAVVVVVIIRKRRNTRLRETRPDTEYSLMDM